MNSILERSLKTAQGGKQAAEMAADETRRLAQAAEKKRREESEAETAAILESDRTGRAVYWQRRITTGTNADSETGLETGRATESVRAGSYSPRAFLRLAAMAARQAGRGRWRQEEAVESVAAELVARVLSKTEGAIPKRGSLGRETGHENPDLAYLTASARRLIASAERGDSDAAGLAAECAPKSAESEASAIAGATLAELAEGAAVQAEGAADPMHDGTGDFLAPPVRAAAENLAAIEGRREGACLLATVAAIRPDLRSCELAEAGYAASPGAARKGAHMGREILREMIESIPASPAYWKAADWRKVESLARLASTDARPNVSRHICEENGAHPYRGVQLEWPLDCDPIPRRER